MSQQKIAEFQQLKNGTLVAIEILEKKKIDTKIFRDRFFKISRDFEMESKFSIDNQKKIRFARTVEEKLVKPMRESFIPGIENEINRLQGNMRDLWMEIENEIKKRS